MDSRVRADSPDASRGTVKVLKSVCRSCHGGCGTLMHVRDGELIKVVGDRESPLNRGRLCPIGTVTRDLVYHPDRLKHPMRRAYRDPWTDIHPDTAARHGITHGEWMWIESPRGRVKQRARLTAGIDPRVINAEHGWWFPEKPGPEYGVWESNINVLTDNGPPYDPAMGTYALRALLCRVARVESGKNS